MARVASMSGDESIKLNLADYTFEVGTNFEPLSGEAVRFFDSYGPTKRVVDLGCGDGAAVKEFVALGYDVTGVDINQAKLNKVNATTVCADFLSYLKALPRGSVDNFFTHHALEHTPDYAEVLRQMGRTLKPDGLCLIIVPAYGEVYSIHHAAFEALEDIAVPQTTPLLSEERIRDEPEFWYLGRKHEA